MNYGNCGLCEIKVETDHPNFLFRHEWPSVHSFQADRSYLRISSSFVAFPSVLLLSSKQQLSNAKPSTMFIYLISVPLNLCCLSAWPINFWSGRQNGGEWIDKTKSKQIRIEIKTNNAWLWRFESKWLNGQWFPLIINLIILLALPRPNWSISDGYWPFRQVDTLKHRQSIELNNSQSSNRDFTRTRACQTHSTLPWGVRPRSDA